jgi:hypothetical protein
MRKKKAIALLKEFYPYIKNESHAAIECGSTPQNHFEACKDTCPDCLWYNWGIQFQNRIKNGEFNEIIN